MIPPKIFHNTDTKMNILTLSRVKTLSRPSRQGVSGTSRTEKGSPLLFSSHISPPVRSFSGGVREEARCWGSLSLLHGGTGRTSFSSSSHLSKALLPQSSSLSLPLLPLHAQGSLCNMQSTHGFAQLLGTGTKILVRRQQVG